MPLILSLPVTWREYTASKILANLIIFAVPWLIILSCAISCALGVLLLPGATHGLVAFTAIMAVEMLVTTCLIIVAGLITESQAWTRSPFCTLAWASISWASPSLISAASPYMWGANVHVAPTAWLVLIAELLMVPLLLGMTFYIQSRKTDFL